jgi:hypothetical protein
MYRKHPTNCRLLTPFVLAACLVIWGCGGDDGVGPGEDPIETSCSETPTFEQGMTPTIIIHVAVGGDGDGSEADPYGSVGAALAHPQFGPGTAIRIHAGTYNADHYLADIRGTAAAPIWIGGAPGEAKPVFNGGTQAMHVVRPAYVVLHDIEVTGATANGINVDDGGEYADETAAHHVAFRGLDIHDVGVGGNNDGLKLSGLRDYWILDCAFANVSAGSGIDHVGCHRGVIARNTFTNTGANAVQCKGGSTDIEIVRNRFENAGERGVNIGGSTGDQYFRPPLSTSTPNVEARDIRVLANVFVGGVTPFAYVGAVDCVVAHNTVVDPTNWLVRILQETTTHGGFEFLETQNCELTNNIFYFARGDLSPTDINVGPNTQPQTYTLRNNLWYAHDAPASSEPDYPVAETGGIVGQDPGLRNPGAGQFQPLAAGAAAGAGTAQSWIRGDMAGDCYASPPSVGAYEVE